MTFVKQVPEYCLHKAAGLGAGGREERKRILNLLNVCCVPATFL